MSTGYFDAHGFYHYGEDDAAAPGGEFSAMLNMAADAIPAGVASLVDQKVIELGADPNDGIVKALILDDTTPSETRTALEAVILDVVAANPLPAAVLAKSTSQSLAAATATAVSWNLNLADPAGLHYVGTPTRIVATAAGIYEISTQIYIAATTGYGSIYGRVNGSTKIRGSFDRRPAGSDAGLPLSATFAAVLDVDDYVEIIATSSVAASVVGGSDEQSAGLVVKYLGPS